MPVGSPGASAGLPRSGTLTYVTVLDDTTSAPAIDLSASPVSPGRQQRRERRENGSLPEAVNGLDAAATADRASSSERIPAPSQNGSVIASRGAQNGSVAMESPAPWAAWRGAVAEEKRPVPFAPLTAAARAASQPDQTHMQSAGAAAHPGTACSPGSGPGATAALGGLTLAPQSGSISQVAPLPSSSQVQFPARC